MSLIILGYILGEPQNYKLTLEWLILHGIEGVFVIQRPFDMILVPPQMAHIVYNIVSNHIS